MFVFLCGIFHLYLRYAEKHAVSVLLVHYSHIVFFYKRYIIILYWVFVCCLCSLTLSATSSATVWLLFTLVRNIIQLYGKEATDAATDFSWCLSELLLYLGCRWKTLITIQSQGFLIIRVMMWINYQLNSWSHKSVEDLPCIMGCYSLDGDVNT